MYRTHSQHLDRCIPVTIHGDEGRGHRKAPILIVSVQPAFTINRTSLKSRLLIFNLPDRLYEAKGPTVSYLLSDVAQQLIELFHDGLTLKSGERVYLVCLGEKGSTMEV